MTSLQTLVASYADADAARRAVVTLRGAHVPEAAISLVGEAAARAETAAELVREDRSVIWRIFWAGLIWGGAGAIGGAALGYALALLAWPTGNVAIQVASWAMFVHIAATLWAAYAVIDSARERDRAPSVRARSPMVVVRTVDAALIERAEAVLRATGAAGVQRT